MVHSISADEAIVHNRTDGAVVVDARPQVMRHQGSVPGAVVVEPTEVSMAFAPSDTGSFPAIASRDTEINVVSVRSQAARIAEQIADLGYTNVHYVDGGYPAIRTARVDR